MQPINTNTFPSLLSGMFDGGAPTQGAVEMSAAEIQDSIRAADNRVFRESTIPKGLNLDWNGVAQPNPGQKYVEQPNTVSVPLQPTLDINPGTVGMGAINPSVFPAIANGMFGNANTGGNAASSFGWQNAQPAQGTGGKGVGNVINASANNLIPKITPIAVDSAQSLMQLANSPRDQGPYQYGNLGLTSSDYSLWGSRGNPYLVAGPTYTPGSGLPINPQPIAPIAPPSNGGGDGDYPTAPGTGGDSGLGDQPWANRKVLGDLYPGLGLAYGLVDGRIDNPYGEGYARLPWYEGSAGGGYGYTEEGYDQFAPGDTDRGIYSNYYDANGNLVSERGWDDSFDDYNTGDNWANTGFWEGMGNIFGGRTWDGLEEPATFGDPASDLAKQSDAAITQAEAAKQAEKQAAAQAKLNEIAKYTGMLQGEFDAQMAAQEDLNDGQIELMTQIKGDMQRDFGDFTTQNSQQMAQMAAENASMFDSIEEYRAWQLDTDAHQQSWIENQFKDQAATQNDLNSTQTDLMNQIAMDMQGTYGEFSGQMGEQLANMAAENASMFDNFAEYKQWMGEEFTTLESGLNEQLAQQAAVNEGLNSNQIDLMNTIAEDMQTQYGEFSGGVGGQLEQMAAENASLFDSVEEYQQWMAGHTDTAPPGTVTPPSDGGSSSDNGYGDSSGGGGGWEGSDANSDMDADSGWSGADSDFDADDGWGDWGDDDGGFE